jgi:hypothetical protein
MSNLHISTTDQVSVNLAMVDHLRRQAEQCRETAARISNKHRRIADMLLATGREYDEHAARLEAKVMMSRTLQ